MITKHFPHTHQKLSLGRIEKRRPLKIGIDARPLRCGTTRMRGIGRYLLNQLRAMLTLAPDCEFTLYGNDAIWHQDYFSSFLSFKNIHYSAFHPSFWKDLDLFHLTDPLPLIPGTPLLPYPSEDLPLIATIYDLIPLAFREAYLDPNPQMKREYDEKLVFLQEHCQIFLAISNFVAEDAQSRLQLEANRIVPVLGGLDPVFQTPLLPEDISAIRQKYDLHEPYFIYSGGTDFRKNLITLIVAFAKAVRDFGLDYSLVFTGELNEKFLRNTTERLRCEDILPRMKTLGYVSDDELKCLYHESTAMVFPSLYEGFGLPALESMACGSPVIAARRGSLPEIVGDAGLLIEPENPTQIAEAMKTLAEDANFRERLIKKGTERAKRYQWEYVAEKTLYTYQEVAPRSRSVRRQERRMRVLFQNRPNALTHPGGDTGIMNGLHDGLATLDVSVNGSAEPGDLRTVDIVHLVNLTILPASRIFAQNALRQDVPYVVTTLYEDWPLFRSKSDAAYALFNDYMRSEYDKGQFENRLRLLRELPPAEGLDNGFVTARARALFASGEREAARLRRDFSEAADRVHSVPFGIRVPELPLNLPKESLKKVRDLGPFVFCVGRLETRKNQLMLLKALEDDDLTILFGTGGFTYQPEYENLCKTYLRRGQTACLGRVPEAQLGAIYSLAACHALPSWYELPGLVSLEAVAMGCPAVASSWGGIEDYLQEDSLFTCEPDNPDSIRDAVLKAIETKPSEEAIEHVREFTWQRSAEQTFEHYENILSHTGKRLRLREEFSAFPQNIEKDSTMIKAKTPLEPQFDCSIILSVQNNAEATQACLEAISANESDFSYEVIILDNGSTDTTPKLLAAIEGDVQILTQTEPLPYGRALNLAAAKARGEYLLFLNPATEPRPEQLKTMLTTAQKDSNVFAVGGTLTHSDQTIEHMGFAFRDNKVPFSLYRNFPVNHDAAKRMRTMQAASAACLLVRQSSFEQIGGFDEQVPSSFADIDLCFRLRMSGGNILVTPEASVLYNGTTALTAESYSQQDLQQFLGRWANKITADGETLTAEDGYRIDWDESGAPRYNKSETVTEAQHSTGEHNAEWEVLAKLMQSGTGTLDAIREFSELSQELNRAEEAEKIFADLKPDYQVSFEHARLLYHMENFELAAQKLKDITKHSQELSETNRFEAWQLLGNCWTHLQRSEEAEQAYYHALLENPSSERPYLGLGSVALTEQNWQAAQYGFTVAAAHAPDSTKAHFGLGLALSARGKQETAAKEFSKLLDEQPSHPEALFNLYKIAMETEKLEIVEIPLKTYLENHPDDTDFLFNLAGLQFKMGQHTSAAETCRRVLSLKPEHVAAKEVLQELEKQA